MEMTRQVVLVGVTIVELLAIVFFFHFIFQVVIWTERSKSTCCLFGLTNAADGTEMGATTLTSVPVAIQG